MSISSESFWIQIPPKKLHHSQNDASDTSIMRRYLYHLVSTGHIIYICTSLVIVYHLLSLWIYLTNWHSIYLSISLYFFCVKMCILKGQVFAIHITGQAPCAAPWGAYWAAFARHIRGGGYGGGGMGDVHRFKMFEEADDSQRLWIFLDIGKLDEMHWHDMK